MPAHPSRDSGRAAPAAAGAAMAGAVALVLSGAALAWAVYDAPRAAHRLVDLGGGAAVLVIVVAVTTAAYYARVARTARAHGAASALEAQRAEAEFTRLARETIPYLITRVRAGEAPAAVLAVTAAPDSPAVREVLTRVTGEVADAGRRESAAAADRAAANAARAALEAEVAALAGQTLPTAVGQMRDGEPADTVLVGVPRPDNGQLGALLDTVVNEVAAAERRGATAMAACASAAARIQAQTTRMLAELREMENRHGGEDKVFADLMELDHRVSQLGRLADSIALLAGGRSGRRWTKPIPMESILRGAMSRIDAYQRVRLHSTSTAAVVGYAAEGVMHALAELMDNAAAFSAHGSEVHAYVEEEDVGVVVTIEDSGLGMRKRERGRAESLIAQPFSLATLPGTRLGLAVVGRVADRYGLSVNFRPSSRGGTGVVVMIPRQLLTQQREQGYGAGQADLAGSGLPSHFASAEEPAGARQQPEPAVAPAVEDLDDLDDLPVRPRGRTLASASASLPESVPQPVTQSAPGWGTEAPAWGTEGAASPAPGQSRDASSRFAAFREAGERARSAQQGPRDQTN